ncbi:hypothetical protein BCL69_10882 [Nitrosomonas communis]|uniref:Metallo-beta-lactamase domain-containing protein n=1 Tax=Nitrosomonas communis TaxID=44574 RepID=A0A5D3Y7K3_9PROT|nr:hypothetical protein BCL69_10882 [Nitrosomonas communis]
MWLSILTANIRLIIFSKLILGEKRSLNVFQKAEGVWLRTKLLFTWMWEGCRRTDRSASGYRGIFGIAWNNNLSISYIFETHRQEDFEFGSRSLAQATGAQVMTGKHELFGASDIRLDNGQELMVGTTCFVAYETPGHTPESMIYAVFPKDVGRKCWGVFTGDTLFVGETVRMDLSDPEKGRENAAALYDAIHKKIAPLGDQAIIFPAHGTGSASGGNISDRDDSTIGSVDVLR